MKDELFNGELREGNMHASSEFTVWNEKGINDGMIDIIAREYKGTLVYPSERVIGMVRHRQRDLYTLEDLKKVKVINEANILRTVHSAGYTFIVCLVDKVINLTDIRINKHITVVYENRAIELTLDDTLLKEDNMYTIRAWELYEDDDNNSGLIWYKLTFDNPNCDGEPIKITFLTEEY
ncbi:hypothetical protein MWG61_13380 [Bacillus safensis]|uniref:hypothetical protein n=1 Tax=Bacillus safensis TaxID=561879 RepID=UPI0022831871|nr:hypothetical protein [Bacillus safensis]MCY7525132.1 hypothetical protein [Bacillus safensis]